MNEWDNEEKERVGQYRSRILDALIEGPKLNHELVSITHRFSATIHQLREIGHKIESRHVRGGIWKYIWHERMEIVRTTKTIQSQYYQTHHWKTKRLERIQIDGNVCCQCKSSSELEVHHWEYDLFNEDIQSLMTFCKLCHEHLHSNPKISISFPKTFPAKYLDLMKIKGNCTHEPDKWETVQSVEGVQIVCACGKFVGWKHPQQQNRSLFDY